MTRRRKLTFAAGAAAIAVLVVGLGAAGAVAASSLLSPSEESKAIIDDAAEQLGVDARRTVGRAQAGAEEPSRRGGRGRPPDRGAGDRSSRSESTRTSTRSVRSVAGIVGLGFGHHAHFEIIGAAASYLGMTEAELREALQDSTLAEIAKEKGKTVPGLVKALVAAQEKRIDEARRRRTDHGRAGVGAEGQARRPHGGARERRAPPAGRRPRFPVLARIRLPASATSVLRSARVVRFAGVRREPGLGSS